MSVLLLTILTLIDLEWPGAEFEPPVVTRTVVLVRVGCVVVGTLFITPVVTRAVTVFVLKTGLLKTGRHLCLLKTFKLLLRDRHQVLIDIPMCLVERGIIHIVVDNNSRTSNHKKKQKGPQQTHLRQQAHYT